MLRRKSPIISHFDAVAIFAESRWRHNPKSVPYEKNDRYQHASYPGLLSDLTAADLGSDDYAIRSRLEFRPTGSFLISLQ
jgi:hypothetical protein